MRRALPALLLALGVAAAAEEPVTFTDAEVKRLLQHSPLPPPPANETNAHADDPGAAALGQALFFEPRLSKGGDISCATCHRPERSFTDGRALSRGVADGRRHTPSLWNVAYNRWLFWDGRADSLWSQALHPIEDPLEMAGSRAAVVAAVRGDARLRAAYQSVFGPLPAAGAGRPEVNRAFANLGKAIEAYERRLLSRRAPFDVFVEGVREQDAAKQAALSPAARRGLKLFLGRGNCRTCHTGPTFTDGEFHAIELPPTGVADPGRLEGIERVVKDEFGAGGAFSDRTDGPRAQNVRFLSRAPHAQGQFKTPTLRNVARTAPYMHNGQLATLADVLAHYSTLENRPPAGPHQEVVLAPLSLSSDETADLLAFLESLTDTSLDPALLRPPGPVRAGSPSRARRTTLRQSSSR
jgi:cytochrome c peroxidase